MKNRLLEESFTDLARRFQTASKQAGPRASVAPDVAETIQRAFAAAGLDAQGAPMQGMGDAIRDTLQRAGLAPLLQAGPTADGGARAPLAPRPHAPKRRPGTTAEPALPGTFEAHSFSGPTGTRSYRLYVPSTCKAGAAATALVVMLHGCTQSPDDFAAGTRMNALAEQHGFLVAYPAQSPNANGSKCWNWFRPEDQQRDRGEPALIAGLTREIASRYGIGPGRVFVAGLSAGAAMAVILGETYPELFAAVGAHSGLPYGAAHDMPSAFGAMRTGSGNTRQAPRGRVPTIVFHGDQDQTVDARNGAAISERAAGAHAQGSGLRAAVQTGTSPDGSRYQRTAHLDAEGRPLVEHWLLHGAGHAWSGGSPAGSFTDARGPDASAEMVRFFLAQPLRT